LETLFNLHRPVSAVHVEKTAYQLTFVQQMRARGMPVREFDPKDHGDKYARALFASGRFEGEMMLFPRGKRITKVVEEELFSYPFGTHDDIVDTVSMAAIITGAKSPLNLRLIDGGSNGGIDWNRTGWTREL
jgi:phage terminase large subunit-like protein